MTISSKLALPSLNHRSAPLPIAAPDLSPYRVESYARRTRAAAARAGDRLGNSFARATNVTVSTAVRSVSDTVSRRDSDFLKFTLPAPGNVRLSLTGLSADANLELYDRDRRLIGASSNGRREGESLVQRLVDFGSTFYVRVVPGSRSSANYRLSYSLQPDRPIRTATGLQFVNLASGTGAVPNRGQLVLVQYTGRLTNGRVFDSSLNRSQPFAFRLGQGQVIAGWDEGIASMRVGSRRQLIIPPALGYGSTGAGRDIPPNATLIFDVELLGIYT